MAYHLKVEQIMLSRDFHDEKLLSIAVVDDILTLQVSAQDKVSQLQVSGIEKLRLTDFKEGNIINVARVVYPERSACSEGVSRSLLKYVYELNDSDLKENKKISSFLDEKVKEHNEGSLLILEIEPSYGAYLVAIGKEITEK